MAILKTKLVPSALAPYPATSPPIFNSWIPVRSLIGPSIEYRARLFTSLLPCASASAAAPTPAPTHQPTTRQGRRGNPTVCQLIASPLAAAAIAASLPVAAAAEASVAPAVIGVCRLLPGDEGREQRVGERIGGTDMEVFQLLGNRG